MSDVGIERRTLGRTGLKASVIGFGCNRIAGPNAARDRAATVATMAAAIDRGINFFDTADIYGNGESERLLGTVARGRRDTLIVCSKVGYRLRHGAASAARAVRRVAGPLLRRVPAMGAAVSAAGKRFTTQNFDPRYVHGAVEASLRRLGTDYLDILLLHSPPAAAVEGGAVFEALEDLKRKGSVRHYGVSLGDRDTGRLTEAALGHPGVAALQVTVNPLRQEALAQVLPRLAGRDLAVIARMPFDKGRVLDDPGLKVPLGAVPERTAAQTALRFALRQEGVGVVLVGMTAIAHLEENLAALAAPPLTGREMARIRARGAPRGD